MYFVSQGVQLCTRTLLKSTQQNICVATAFKKILSTRPNSTKTGGAMKGIFKLGLVGITAGAVIGTGYSIHKLNQPRLHIINEEIAIPSIDKHPGTVPSRTIRYDNDTSDLKLTLYQYQTCPFCCKVRAFLDYHGISYDVVEVDPVLRQSIKWSSYKKVPILVAKTAEGYQPLNDSSMIISVLATYLKDKKDLSDIVQCYPFISFVDEDGSKKSEIMNKYFLVLGESAPISDATNEERKWRKWADDVLVHTLSPNVYRTKDEALQAFNWFSEVGEWDKNFPAWERNLIVYVGASAMWLIGKKLKRKYQLKDDVRESLYDECNRWARAVKAKGTLFMGGAQPNLADLAVFGILSSIEGCTAFGDVLNHSNVKDWFLRMKNEVRLHHGSQFL